MLGRKKAVVLLVLTSWIFLSGISFSENLGYFNDTSEHSDQTIEHVLSSPVDRPDNTSDELPDAFVFVGFMGIKVFQSTSINQPTSINYTYSGRFKLFHLHSAYLI